MTETVQILSDFKIHILTNFLMQEYGQRLNKANGTFSGQIGPEVPSGSIKEFSIRFKQKFVDLFVFALSRFDYGKNKFFCCC